ncbi:MAG: diaminopimelate epimerase [Gemmatimonadetes bacterium]|nr:MAG: diaminopimelate epimerase [Gemmatimonadota bacterium]PYP53488.1 MAG: diaminopimelate epimerase [Gemmatimonadota bacterium]
MVQRPEGQHFFKVTGSGNDFVVFDSTTSAAAAGTGAGAAAGLENAETIRSLTARGTGIGADGVVFLERAGDGDVAMRYYNSDGSEAALCGNASLCSTRLAVELGMAQAGGFLLHTAAGSLRARIRDNLPEVDLEPVTEVRSDAKDLGLKPGERRLGYAKVGVPHLVVEVPDIESADVAGRGAELRHHRALADGANVNFVSKRSNGEFAYRTFERGVEAETLACGTGAVATAIILSEWGESASETVLWTRSSLPLVVSLKHNGQAWLPSLRGEGRIVFEGRIRDLD